MLYSFYPNLKRLDLSHSSRGTYNTCEKKLEFAKFFEWPRIKDDYDGDAAVIGQALHIGYQTWLKNKNLEEAIWAYAQHYPINQVPDPINNRSLEAGISALVAMTSSKDLTPYELTEIKCVDGLTRPALEVPFEIKISNFSLSDIQDIPVYYVGFIDGIVYSLLDQTYIVIDVKTHRRNKPADMFYVYANDDQCIPYAVVLEHIQNRPIKSLTVIYISVYIDILKASVKPYQITKSEIDIQDWLRTFYSDLNDIKAYYQMGWFPKRGSRCVDSYGNICRFFKYCHDVHNKQLVKQAIDQMKENISSEKIWERPEPWIKAELEFEKMSEVA